MGGSKLHYGLEAKLASAFDELELTEGEIVRIETLAARLHGLRTNS